MDLIRVGYRLIDLYTQDGAPLKPARLSVQIDVITKSGNYPPPYTKADVPIPLSNPIPEHVEPEVRPEVEPKMELEVNPEVESEPEVEHAVTSVEPVVETMDEISGADEPITEQDVTLEFVTRLSQVTPDSDANPVFQETESTLQNTTVALTDTEPLDSINEDVLPDIVQLKPQLMLTASQRSAQNRKNSKSENIPLVPLVNVPVSTKLPPKRKPRSTVPMRNQGIQCPTPGLLNRQRKSTPNKRANSNNARYTPTTNNSHKSSEPLLNSTIDKRRKIPSKYPGTKPISSRSSSKTRKPLKCAFCNSYKCEFPIEKL